MKNFVNSGNDVKKSGWGMTQTNYCRNPYGEEKHVVILQIQLQDGNSEKRRGSLGT
jgi:hypothetical protein